MNRFSLAQRVLHWLIALTALCVLAVGLLFMVLGYDSTVATFGDAVTNGLYKYHKTFGIVILLLMLLRVGMRRLLPIPPYQPPLAPFVRVASRVVHLSFYVLLIAMPIVGWLATAAGGYPIQFFDYKLPGLIGKNEALSQTLYGIHGAGGLCLLFLIALHVAAAIRHMLRKDGVMRRISLP